MFKALNFILAGIGTGAMAISAAPTAAQTIDPAVQTVESLDNGLLAAMRAGSAAGQAGRVRMLAPIIERAFDLPLMTRLSVGPLWTTMSDRDQSALQGAFRALTVAQYAKNFDGYSGQRFAVVGAVEVRGVDKLVRTTLTSPGSPVEELNYRLRETGGQWKIIDVYYKNAISQLATRRSDFAGVVNKGGAPALIAHLNQLAANPK